jgi:hypothetical protein
MVLEGAKKILRIRAASESAGRPSATGTAGVLMCAPKGSSTRAVVARGAENETAAWNRRPFGSRGPGKRVTKGHPKLYGRILPEPGPSRPHGEFDLRSLIFGFGVSGVSGAMPDWTGGNSRQRKRPPDSSGRPLFRAVNLCFRHAPRRLYRNSEFSGLRRRAQPRPYSSETLRMVSELPLCMPRK